MKIEEIKTIVKLMSEHDLTEFKIESEACNLCIRRGGAVSAATPVVVSAPAPVAVAAVAAPAPAAVAAPAAPAAASAPVRSIDSPLVGTFYRAASPDAAPFIKVGDRVNEDTVIGIIEAMKVMNEIKAEKTGVIKELMVENGQPVEYGQPIFILE